MTTTKNINFEVPQRECRCGDIIEDRNRSVTHCKTCLHHMNRKKYHNMVLRNRTKSGQLRMHPEMDENLKNLGVNNKK